METAPNKVWRKIGVRDYSASGSKCDSITQHVFLPSDCILLSMMGTIVDHRICVCSEGGGGRGRRRKGGGEEEGGEEEEEEKDEEGGGDGKRSENRGRGRGWWREKEVGKSSRI